MEKEKLGIPSNGTIYHKLKPSQNLLVESLKTNNFLSSVLKGFCDQENIDKELCKLAFINYGDTQLVYVLSTPEIQYAVLVGQPATRFGIVKDEYINLLELSDKNERYIATPKTYAKGKDREMYIAPYYKQARCVASDESGWGVYIPEPHYRFENFSEHQRKTVNISMIALLVKMYDDENKKGIADCRVGGGDFILEKEWSDEPPSFSNTVNRMKLISARKFIKIEFTEYLKLLSKEFLLNTYYSDDKKRNPLILINIKNRQPMTIEEIQKGIALGIKLRNIPQNLEIKDSIIDLDLSSSFLIKKL